MELNIRDYLHLYLGCDYVTDNSQGNMNPSTLPSVLKYLDDFTGFKLILRRFENMTDAEIRDLIQYDKLKVMYKTVEYSFDGTSIRITYTIEEDEGSTAQTYRIDRFAMNAHDFAWCLRKGFDLFGLIHVGLAIDKSTFNQD